MTENEIKSKLEVLKDWVGDASLTRKDMQNVINESIKALEEIQQYRAIGTVEKLSKLNELYDKAKWLLDDERKKRKSFEAIGTIEEIKEKLSLLEKYEELGTVEELDEVLNMFC